MGTTRGPSARRLDTGATRTARRPTPALRLLLPLAVAPTAGASTHPRLLIRPADVPHLRHACGLGAPLPPDAAPARFGIDALRFNALRARAAPRQAGLALPGEVSAAAFCLLLAPDDPAARGWAAFVEAELRRPILATSDPLERLLALDWAWDAIADDARSEFVRQLRDRAVPLTPADSPLDHRLFRGRLDGLALAALLDESDEPGPAWAAQRARLLAAARDYAERTLPAFTAWRGLAPTGPAVAADEESDTALLIELAGTLLGEDLWPRHASGVGRWLEHYLYAAQSHPALQHHFLRDDGTSAPLTPASGWDGLLPLTAHLIAARTRDPAAAALAVRLEADIDAAAPHAAPWAWVPIAFPARGVPTVDGSALPPARNLGGAIVLRGGRPPFETTVWIEAAQPWLRRGQSFDAGHFLIHANGHLAIGAGDDVAFEATPAKDGGQWLADRRDPFDFSTFAAATIAHNCLLLFNPTDVPRWYGRAYEPRGGQRLIENTCTDFAGDLHAADRCTGSLLAYGYHAHGAYAALDLTAAYPKRSAGRYTREFIFLWESALIVVDRVQALAPGITPICVLQLPARPRVDGADLPESLRTAGDDNHAGIWCFDDARRLEWTERDGGLCCVPLAPQDRRIVVAGGPARRNVVPSGPSAGRTYVGGSADSFERLITPAGRPNPRNAWYRLGSPTLLGADFARAPVWGRVEVYPATQQRDCVFITLLFAAPADASPCPQVELQRSDLTLCIQLTRADDRARITLPADGGVGGRIEWTGAARGEFVFPETVRPDPPLPTVPPSRP